MAKTTSKAAAATAAREAAATAAREAEDKRIQDINVQLKKINDVYNSKKSEANIGREIGNSMKIISKLMNMEPPGSQMTAAFKVSVLEEVKKKYGIDSPSMTIAYNYNKILAESKRGAAAKARASASAAAAEVAEELEDEEYNEDDKEIILDAVEKVAEVSITEPAKLKATAESELKSAFEETKKEETKEEEKRIIKLVKDSVQAQISIESERPALSEAKAAETTMTGRPRSSIADAFRGTSTYYNIGSKLPVPKSYKESNPERPALSESKAAEMTMTSSRPALSESNPERPALSESKAAEITISARAPESQEPIIERALVSEQQQIKNDQEEPFSFSSQNLFSQKIKEGKTKLEDLQENFNYPLEYPNQLLKLINMIGGWEQYKYNKSKFGLIDDVKGDDDYLENMKNSLINVCGDDIGVEDNEVNNLNQAVKELMIMKNCYYIYKFKAVLPPQYGLIINANRLMTVADLVGKGNKDVGGQTNKKGQKPIIQGKERVEFEDQRKELITQSMEPKQGPTREFVPKPDINQDTINKSQLQRGNRGLMQINMGSLNKRLINSGSLNQADSIAKGIKIIKPKKQFGRY